METLETNRSKVVEGFVALIKMTSSIKFRKHNMNFNELYNYMPRTFGLSWRNSRGLRPQGWVEAAARKLPRGALGRDALTTEGYAGKRPAEHFKRFKGLKAGKRQA